ncbi:MAG: hypothetical protein MSH47_02160 [Bacteroidales bacterium]|nr:hypothetical protein [Bacteroidales bacterium]MDY5194270.1 hypothetical protein [Candidatus Aphodosoma sp.]
MNITLTKYLQKRSLPSVLTGIILSTILWFLPEIIGLRDTTVMVDVMFMKHYVLWSWPMWVSHIVAYFFTIIVLIWLTDLCERLQIIPIRSAIPFLLGLLLISSIYYLQLFDERSIALICFLVALKQLFGMYHFEWQVVAGFNITLMLGIAAFFEPQYVWLSALFILGMIIFRVITRRIFLSVILAILLILLMSASIFWLFDAVPVLIDYSSEFLKVTLLDTIEVHRSDIIMGVFLLLLNLYSIFGYLVTNSHYKLNVRFNFTFVNWGFWISIIWVALFVGCFQHLIIIPFIFIILWSSLLFSTNHSNVTNILFLSLILISIIYRILWLLNF